MENSTMTTGIECERGHIPAIVSEFANAPLHIVAAEWAMRTDNLLTIDVIMKEFSLTQRQASNIINEICRDKECIVFEKVVSFKSYPKIRHAGIRVFKVKHPSNNMKSKMSEDIKYKISKDDLNIIRKWMCIRKLGDDFSLIEKHLSNTE